MSSFDLAFYKVQILVSDFEQDLHHYLNPNYSEAQVRLDFIDKFFIALGWDVRNDNRINPVFREVKIEKTQKQLKSKAQKRADYAFYVSPDFNNVKFFAEAKKPSRDLHNSDDYFQTSRYGWNADVGISILTDFEELHIIDCRAEPKINRIFEGQHKVYHFTDYKDSDKFAEVYWLLSREAVIAGNIDNYISKLSKPTKGAWQANLFGGKWQSIDEKFLEDIDSIRETLAKAFKKNDNNLTSELLTEAVTRTIDRLVFIRFLEDKQIEPENLVSEFGNKQNAWKDFINVCKILDAKYNGVVFKRHFIDSQDFTGAEITHFKNICNELSHLNTPYDFNVIPIHILGSIYERFLGKVVISTDKRVKIEEKIEVRKAGGVYYTPKNIVEEIVKNTVGKLLTNKTPLQISKLRFADISCGSGSFLISVLGCIFEYLTIYYNKYSDEAKKDKCKKVDELYVLSIQQKQQILLNNIYGVDLDHQATEVTQLSLYLKMLEDETTASANDMQILFHEKILPDLSKNILHGNSLIEPDILDGELNFQEEIQLNAFDFESAFPKIFGTDKFDVILGNPPYVRGTSFSSKQSQYFKNKYCCPIDLFSMFLERGTNLIKTGGYLGYIVPSLFIKGVNYSPIRKFLNNEAKELNMSQKGDKVFAGVQMPTTVMILKKGVNKHNKNLFSNPNTKFFIKRDFIPLGSISNIRRGLEIGKDKLSKSGYKKCITGTNIEKYNIKSNSYITKETYELYKKDENIFKSPKILVRETGDSFYSVIDYENSITNRSIYCVKINKLYSPEVILGILNSTLFLKYFQFFIMPETKIFPKIRISQLKDVPLPNIDLENNQTDNEQCSIIKQSVLEIHSIKNKVKTVLTETDKEYLERKVLSNQKSINNAVYKLYNLTIEETKDLEGI